MYLIPTILMEGPMKISTAYIGIFGAVVFIVGVVMAINAMAASEVETYICSPPSVNEDSDCDIRGGGDDGAGGTGSCPSTNCAPGNTYCYTSSSGDKQCTCQNNGQWGPEVNCKAFNQACSCQGTGCRCINK